MENIVAARDAYDWLADADPDQWVVEGLIHNTLTMLTAKREVGKSLVTTDLAPVLTRGEDTWLGRKVKPGFPDRIYYLVTDAGTERDTSRRVVELGVPKGSVTVARVRRGPAEVAQWREFGEKLREDGYGLVVVDNGTGLVHDIVKPEYVNPLFDGLKELTDAGLAVLLVHHEPKGGQSAAGNYIWESEPRWRLNLAKVGDEYRTLSCEGNALTDLPPVIPLRMPRKTHPGSRFTLADGRNRVSEVRSEERIDRHDEYLLRMLGRSDWKSQSEIAESVGISQKTVSRVLTGKGYRLEDGQVVKLETAGSPV